MRRGGVVGLLVLLAGCASGGPAVSASTLAACTASSAPDGWREVRNADFSFCVPASWSSSDSRVWRGDGGGIEWGTGVRRRRVASTTAIVRTRGGGPPTEAEIQAAIADQVRSLYRQTETINGVEATLWITQAEGSFLTGADFQSGPGVYLSGEATDRPSADQQLVIYRTVRLSRR